jgi:hypothetical protein
VKNLESFGMDLGIDEEDLEVGYFGRWRNRGSSEEVVAAVMPVDPIQKVATFWTRCLDYFVVDQYKAVDLVSKLAWNVKKRYGWLFLARRR